MTPEAKAREILAIIKPPNAYSEIDVEHVAQALRDVERETLERAAKVAEDSVRQKCCGHGRVVCDTRGEPVGEECCGNPDIEPMYPNEIAQSIRSLLQKEGGNV